MSEHPIDGEAIAASLADPPAFGVIFERHFGAIHGYLRRRLDRRLADELASQTFLVAFDRRAHFDHRRFDSRPWLFGIATNLARNHRRREIREMRAIAQLTPDPVVGIDGVESRIDAERMRGRLAQVLADLPSEEADVLLLVAWAELDHSEIADALAIPGGHGEVTSLARPQAPAGRARARAAGREPTRRKPNRPPEVSDGRPDPDPQLPRRVRRWRSPSPRRRLAGA